MGRSDAALGFQSTRPARGETRICDILLTPEQKKDFYDCIRDESGKVRVKATGDQIQELLGQLTDKKK